MNVRENQTSNQEWTPETLVTLGTEDARRWQTQHKNTIQKNKKDEQHEPHQNPGVNTGTREEWAVPASYKTPVVLLIYI